MKMLADHERAYLQKRKGNAYLTNKLYIEKRIEALKIRIKSIGRAVPVMQVLYKVNNKPRVIYFSDVSSEVAILLTQNIQPLAQEITTSAVILGVEIN